MHGGKLRALRLVYIEDVGIAEPDDLARVLFGDVLFGLGIGLAYNADDRGKNADALLTFFHAAAKVLPLPEPGNAGGVGSLQSTHTLPMFY